MGEVENTPEEAKPETAEAAKPAAAGAAKPAAAGAAKPAAAGAAKPAAAGAAKPAAAGAAKPAAAGAAKPAAKKPAAKPKEPLKPFIDNGDGTITDPNAGLMWKKTDAWNDMHKFYLWKDHKEYVDKVNKEKFAGYSDWSIPSKAEASVLFDKDKKKKCMDKNGTHYYIDPIFEAGGVSNTWITECSDDNIIRYDLKCGVDTPYPGNDVFGSMRLVRKAPVAKEEPKAETKAEPKAAEKEPAKEAAKAPAEESAKEE